MNINGELYCDACFLSISKQKHAAIKKPGKNGEAPEDFIHYHDRGPGDCWEKRKPVVLQKAA